MAGLYNPRNGSGQFQSPKSVKKLIARWRSLSQSPAFPRLAQRIPERRRSGKARPRLFLEDRTLMILLGIIFPWLVFFLIGRTWEGVLCLVLQLTVLGWIPASIWALITVFKSRPHSKPPP
jgi:uncharacterized membrane protein YqaE (UPF0057 family)